MKIIYSLLFGLFVVSAGVLLNSKSPEVYVKSSGPQVLPVEVLAETLKPHCVNDIVGAVCTFAGTVPEDRVKDGWIRADGQEISPKEHPKLHAVLKDLSRNCQGDICHVIDLNEGFIYKNKDEKNFYSKSLIVYAVKAN